MRVIEIIHHSNDHVEVIFENKHGKRIDYEVFKGEDGEHGMCRFGEDYAGIWTEKNRVIDYDMVYELSKAAIITLRKAGIVVPREFEPEQA